MHKYGSDTILPSRSHRPKDHPSSVDTAPLWMGYILHRERPPSPALRYRTSHQGEPHLSDGSEKCTRLWIITLQDGIEMMIALQNTMHDGPDGPI